VEERWRRLGSPVSVWLAYEDEGRGGHDRGAGADEGDASVLDLARSGAAGGPERAFDDLPEAVDAPVAEAVAHGVERQFAVELDTPVLDEIEGLAFLGRAVRQVEMTICIALLPYDLTRETATVCTVKSGASP
jgi:hypothetical protein